MTHRSNTGSPAGSDPSQNRFRLHAAPTASPQTATPVLAFYKASSPTVVVVAAPPPFLFLLLLPLGRRKEDEGVRARPFASPHAVGDGERSLRGRDGRPGPQGQQGQAEGERVRGRRVVGRPEEGGEGADKAGWQRGRQPAHGRTRTWCAPEKTRAPPCFLLPGLFLLF